MNQGDNFQVPFLSALRKWKAEEEKWKKHGEWTTLYWEKECFIALFYMTGFYFLDRCCLPIISHCCYSYSYSLLLIVYYFSHSWFIFRLILLFVFLGELLGWENVMEWIGVDCSWWTCLWIIILELELIKIAKNDPKFRG